MFVKNSAAADPASILTERYVGTTIHGLDPRVFEHLRGPVICGAGVFGAICQALVDVLGSVEAARAAIASRILADEDDISAVAEAARMPIASHAPYFAETVAMTLLRTVASDGLGGANIMRGAGFDPRAVVRAIHALRDAGHGATPILKGPLQEAPPALREMMYAYVVSVADDIGVPAEEITVRGIIRYPGCVLRDDTTRFPSRPGNSRRWPGERARSSRRRYSGRPWREKVDGAPPPRRFGGSRTSRSYAAAARAATAEDARGHLH